MSFLLLKRTICLKFVCFAVYSDCTGLHDSILIHVVTFLVYIDPTSLHDSVFVEIIFLVICVGKPSGVRLFVNQKQPVASACSPSTFGCFRGNVTVVRNSRCFGRVSVSLLELRMVFSLKFSFYLNFEWCFFLLNPLLMKLCLISWRLRTLL